MKVIAGLRASGKTHEAIRIANQTGAYLVVATHQDAVRLADQCVRFPVTFDELLRGDGLRGSHVKNIVIDNADDFLRRVAGALKVEAITIDGGGIEAAQRWHLSGQNLDAAAAPKPEVGPGDDQCDISECEAIVASPDGEFRGKLTVASIEEANNTIWLHGAIADAKPGDVIILKRGDSEV